MKHDTLTRYAAVVPVLVDAGCAGTDWIHSIRRYLETKSDYIKDEQEHWEGVYIAVLEQWFHQTVVPRFRPQVHELDPPFFDEEEQVWRWCAHDDTGSDPDPTEANIQCLEALAEVIGGGA